VILYSGKMKGLLDYLEMIRQTQAGEIKDIPARYAVRKSILSIKRPDGRNMFVGIVSRN